MVVGDRIVVIILPKQVLGVVVRNLDSCNNAPLIILGGGSGGIE